MEEIKFIICISCFCCLFSEFSGIMQWIKHEFRTVLSTSQDLDSRKGTRGPLIETAVKYPKLKPFDCAKCLSFWMGLVLFSLRGDGILAIFYASICSVLSIYIVKYAK